MKTCKKCQESKNEDDFYRNHDECKKCWNKYCSERRVKIKEEDPNFLEKRRAYLREWREKNKEKNDSYWKKSLQQEKDTNYAQRKTTEGRKKSNEAVKKWRLKNAERFKETEKVRRLRDVYKERARRNLYKAVTRGKILRPNECSKCLKQCKPEAHHTDYSKPLEVTWLCNICHRHMHGKLMDIKI